MPLRSSRREAARSPKPRPLTWAGGAALLRGIGCNWLVCLAVWMALASDDIAGKILAIWFPIMAFVALGLEHSVANMFFIPLGMFNGANVRSSDMLWSNLLPVTIGNIIGGGPVRRRHLLVDLRSRLVHCTQLR